jgi:hypothetical protein
MASSNTSNAPGGGSSPFAPYVTTINMDDPLMKRVPFTMMDIGANAASMPGFKSGVGSIEHTGKSPTKA